MAFDPFGNLTRNHLLQNPNAIAQYTSLLPLPNLVINGNPMSQSEINAGQLLSLVFPGNFTPRVYLSNIFDQNNQALAAYYNTKGQWVLPAYKSGRIAEVQRSLIGLKEADFIVTTLMGNIDFCLEVDGKTHCEDKQKLSDLTKNSIFLAHGLKVYRVTNSEIDSIAGFPGAQQFSAFQTLLQLADMRWQKFVSARNIFTLQLHKPY